MKMMIKKQRAIIKNVILIIALLFFFLKGLVLIFNYWCCRLFEYKYQSVIFGEIYNPLMQLSVHEKCTNNA